MNSNILTPEEIFRLLKELWRLLLAVLVAQIIGLVIGLTLRIYPFWFFSMWYGMAYATPAGYFLGLLWLKESKPGCISKEKIPVLILGVMSLFLPVFGYFFSHLVPEFDKVQNFL